MFTSPGACNPNKIGPATVKLVVIQGTPPSVTRVYARVRIRNGDSSAEVTKDVTLNKISSDTWSADPVKQFSKSETGATANGGYNLSLIAVEAGGERLLTPTPYTGTVAPCNS
jgi:hypothetical protein